MTTKLEQAARALLAKWDAHPYSPWREVGFISGDVSNLREALAEQAEQEPVAWRSIGGMFTPDRLTAARWVSNGGEAIPLYTAPPQREKSEWVSLTDDEVDVLLSYRYSRRYLLRDFESKLKEKNT